MPKLKLKRLPTLQLDNDKKYQTVAFRITVPTSKAKKLSKSLISISKAADMLQVNPDTLRNWERQGKLMPDRTPGGSRRYNLFELEEMQRQLNVKPKVNMPVTGLSVSKAAKLLQVSPDTIRNWDKKGFLPSQRSDGGARRFSKKVILKLQDEMNISAPDTTEEPIELSDLISGHNNSDSNWFNRSLVVSSLVLLGLLGLFLGLYTGFQIMNKLDKVSLNTQNIDSNMAYMQKQLSAVSGVADQARQLSQNIKLETFRPHVEAFNPDSKVLGEFTSSVDQIVLQGSTKVEGLLTAPNVIYSLIAGRNVTISGGQTPTISLELPAFVNSLNGKTGELKLTGGNDITVDGLIIQDTSTLSSIRRRGGCDTCLNDSDIQDNISISSGGNIDANAIKVGQLNAEHGGTGLSTFIAGDLLFADSSTTLIALNIGHEGDLLTVDALGKPAWVAQSNRYNLALDGDGFVVLPKVKIDQLVLSSDTPVNGVAQNYFDVASEIKKTDLRIKDTESTVSAHSNQIASNQTALESLRAEIASLSDKIGSATQISSQSAQTNVDALNLTPPSALMASTSAQLVDLSISSEATFSGQLTAFKASISDTFKSLGETYLGKTTIAGDLVVDGTLSFVNGNTINAMPVLYFQKSDLASTVDFFNGLVTIDKQGVIQAQTVTLSELKVRANKISGTAKIASGGKSVEIDNPLVTARSRILLTPTAETDTVLAVVAKEDNKKFIVSASKNVTADIPFDWWLINEVE